MTKRILYVLSRYAGLLLSCVAGLIISNLVIPYGSTIPFRDGIPLGVGIIFADDSAKQPANNKSDKTEEIVVTASRTKSNPEDAPNSITIITSDDIKTSPFEKVEDILRGTAGVNVNFDYTLNVVAGNRPVNLRGTGGKGERTLVLVDGIPQNNAYDGWVEWSQIPKESIERIEIVRGPASALYGSNALGGVINIITRKPELSRETIFQENYGSMNTYVSNLIQDGKYGKFSYYLNGEYEESDGYIGTDPEKSYDIKRYRKEDRILSKFMYDFDDSSKMTLGFSHFYANRGGGREFLYGYNYNNRFWLEWAKDSQKINWLISLKANNDDWTNLFDASPYTFLYYKQTIPTLGLGASIQSTIKLLDKDTLVAGIDNNKNNLEIHNKYYTVLRSAGAQGTQTSIAPFINNEARLLDDRLIANLGGRYDWIQSTDGKNWDSKPTPLPAYRNEFPSMTWRNFSPKFGLAYHLDKTTTLKTSASTGFRAPSLFELYTTYTMGTLIIDANPHLQPEKILSYDVGVEHQFIDKVAGKLILYQSNARNYIDYNTLTRTHWITDNIAKVKIQGAEAGLNWQLNDEFSALADYTYNKSQIIDFASDPTVEDNYLAYSPLNVYKFGVTYNKPEFLEVQTIVNYNGDRFDTNQNTNKISGYYTVNLSIARQFSKDSKLSLDVTDIFNREYVVYKGTGQDYLSPGRIINLSLKLSF